MSGVLHSAREWARDRNLTVTARAAAKEAVVRARMAGGGARLRPSIFLIGAMKAGTTSLFNTLVNHPELAEPVSKEIRYFDFHFSRGERWYQAHFPTEGEARRRGWSVTGEASPSYLFDPHAPGRIHAFEPDARILVLLRNPIDRAYSHYQHAVRYWGETRAFEEAVRSEESWMAEEQARRVAYPEQMGVKRIQHSYLTRGRYLEQLTPWWECFGRDRVLVLRSEDYFLHPDMVLTQVLRFLGLSEWEPAEFRRLNIASYEGLSDDIRRWLADYYRPYNAALFKTLGRDMQWESTTGGEST